MATFIPLAEIGTKHPEVLGWIITNDLAGNEFAKSLNQQAKKYKQLSENQVAAVLKKLQPQEAPAGISVGELGVQKIHDAFENALGSGIKRPKLRLDDYTFKPAKASGKNPGALYVTLSNNDEYLGKVMEGKFTPVKACTPAHQEKIIAACSDPHAAAVAFGKKTGICACCGRELTNQASIDMGIGPVCAKTYGWI